MLFWWVDHVFKVTKEMWVMYLYEKLCSRKFSKLLSAHEPFGVNGEQRCKWSSYSDNEVQQASYSQKELPRARWRIAAFRNYRANIEAAQHVCSARTSKLPCRSHHSRTVPVSKQWYFTTNLSFLHVATSFFCSLSKFAKRLAQLVNQSLIRKLAILLQGRGKYNPQAKYSWGKVLLCCTEEKENERIFQIKWKNFRIKLVNIDSTTIFPLTVPEEMQGFTLYLNV